MRDINWLVWFGFLLVGLSVCCVCRGASSKKLLFDAQTNGGFCLYVREILVDVRFWFWSDFASVCLFASVVRLSEL